MAKKSKVLLILFLIILLIFLSGALVIIFNIGGAKDFIFSALEKVVISQYPDKLIDGSELKREKEYINIENTKLAGLKIDLENYETQLNDKEKELIEWESRLEEKEKEIQQLDKKLSQEFQELTELLGIYVKMNSEDAAAILSETEDLRHVILVIKNLKKDKAAEILGLMDRKKASHILDNMY